MLNIKQEAAITGRTVEQVEADRQAHLATIAWLDEQITTLGYAPRAYTGPELGSPEWVALPADDPGRLAALLVAARAWATLTAETAERVVNDSFLQMEIGRIQAEEAVEPANELAREMAHDLARTPSYAERVAVQRNYPPVREVRATADWTPVAIPGRPGWFRHFISGKQVDLPTANATGAAA